MNRGRLRDGRIAGGGVGLSAALEQEGTICQRLAHAHTLHAVEEQALRNAYRQGQLAWPNVGLAFEAFRAHCERVLGKPEWDWARFGAELYLCCACARGDREALRALDGEALPQVVRAISRIDSDTEFIQEALQTLRDKLLVGPRPKIADYAARGPLVAWLSVAAARVALDAVRSRNAHELKQVDLPEQLAQEDSSPLNDLVKARYRESFQRALRDAIRALPARDRNLLRLQLVGRCSIDQLGRMYLVHRATAARWLENARNRVFEAVREQIKREHRLSDVEFESIAQGVRSQLDLSITATISGLEGSSASSETDKPDPDQDCAAETDRPSKPE
jgi:RNA polymerase sigma-70 factor (ECF subfamily)